MKHKQLNEAQRRGKIRRIATEEIQRQALKRKEEKKNFKKALENS